MDIALLDTDILSEVLKQRNAAVKQRAMQYLRSHGHFAISAFTRFEVTRGYRRARAVRQITAFESFCQHSIVLPVTDAIFDQAADLWVDAGRGGHPLHDADLIIAATALNAGRVLVTGNTKHFSWIPDLILANWRIP